MYQPIRDEYLPGISNIGVVLSDGWSSYETSHEYSDDTDGVLSRHGEDVLDEECVELHYLPHQHQLDDGHESHVTRLGIQPPEQSEISIVLC